MRRFKLLLALALGVAFTLGTASAKPSRAPEPALWELSAGESKVYLFGSIHMLPAGWAWRTKPIETAIAASDRFVFETTMSPATAANMQRFIRTHGLLPQGQSLSRTLTPDGLQTFKRILARTPLDPAAVDSMRPWLALMVLGDYQVRHGPLRAFADEGVDYRLEQQATEAGRPVGYLETPEFQMRTLMKMTPDIDIVGFEKDLNELLDANSTFRRLLDGWTAGNLASLATILAEEAANNPRDKELLLDARNRNWLPQIESMMLSRKTTFVTVGVAHLVGPASVVDMLCARGWKVQRVKTGPTPPPAACPGARPGPTASVGVRQAAALPSRIQ
jgi:uncharacterized protein